MADSSAPPSPLRSPGHGGGGSPLARNETLVAPARDHAEEDLELAYDSAPSSVVMMQPLVGLGGSAEALHESELLFRTIVTQAAAGVVRTDLEGRITLSNARFGQLVGLAPEALVGSSVSALIHPDDRERNVAEFRDMVENGQPFEL